MSVLYLGRVFRNSAAAGVILLSGCVALPIPTGTASLKDGWKWTDSAEVSTLVRIYDFEDSVATMDEDSRLSLLRDLSAINLSKRSVLQHLQLALVLAGNDPEIADYVAASGSINAAGELIEEQPLLGGYIKTLTQQFDRLARLDLTIQHLSQENGELIRWRRRARGSLAAASAQQKAAELVAPEPLANRLPTAEEEADLLTEQPELPKSLPIPQELAMSRDSELVRIKTLLRLVRAELKQHELTISDQDSKIEVLEAKIKALSAIERNLNQREDQ